MEGTTAERTSGNIFIRECSLAKSGDTISLHVHKYDHTMFVMRGTVEVVIGEHAETLEAPRDILVPAGAHHKITALSDDALFYCVFNHRDYEGRVVEESTAIAAYW